MERESGRFDARAIELAQERLDPKEDLTPYIGEWVALRDGYLVAHDPDPVKLHQHPDVLPSDAFLPVSEPGVQLLGLA